MKQEVNLIDKDQETGEDRLTTLIKQAGDEARARKREALAQHFKKLQSVISEAVSRQQAMSFGVLGLECHFKI